MNHEDLGGRAAFVSPRGEQFLRGDAQCVVDPGRRLVSIKFGKTVTFADIERYAKQLRLNPLFQPECSEIVDPTEVEELDLQAHEFLNSGTRSIRFHRRPSVPLSCGR